MGQLKMAIATSSLLLVSTGCMSWTPGWRQTPVPVPTATNNEPVDAARANHLFDSASDASQLSEAIDAWDRVLRSDPDNLRALEALAEANVLYGAAYAGTRSEKAERYRAGIQMAERAMATNEDFRRRVESGETVGEAADTLGRDEMRAMLFWVTGVSYYFKECLSGPSRLIHFRWMLRTREVMERMLALDPQFEHGTVLFSLAIYHIASPPGAGRDMDLAQDYFARAVEAGPESLLIPWGRAKYLHTRNDAQASFREDLQWVVTQDPKTASSAYRWNVYFQRDARAMLDEIDELFR